MVIKPYLKLILKLSWRQKKKFFLLTFLVLVEVAARLGQPYLYKILVDGLSNGLISGTFTQAAMQSLIVVVAIWFLLSVLNNLTNAETQYLGWEIGNQNSQWVHLDGYLALLRLDYYQHTQKHSSRYAKIVDEGDTSMWEMTNWWLNRFFPAAVGFIGMLVIALSVSVPMTLLLLAVIPPGLGLIITIIKRNEEEQHRVNKLWNLKHEHLSDQITNIITYKLNQNEKLFWEVQKGYSDRASSSQSALNKKWRLASMLNPDVIARLW
ncbi:ABC transporter ATP-binding protein [Candidatus Peregrinibacteria bacterium]|nr:ABC transporter ATP-binding protein [Candidatus Peregrinibacteria bacterium]